MVSILILLDYLFLYDKKVIKLFQDWESQSLFYWIIYSYLVDNDIVVNKERSLNPYFTGLSILIFRKLIET